MCLELRDRLLCYEATSSVFVKRLDCDLHKEKLLNSKGIWSMKKPSPIDVDCVGVCLALDWRCSKA